MTREQCTLVLALTFLLPACNLTQGKACTDIGCASALTFDLTGAPPQTTINLSAMPSHGNDAGGSCVSNANGSCTISLADFTSQTAVVGVTVNGKTNLFGVSPTYQITYPNGPDCPPKCVNARVTLDIASCTSTLCS